MCWDWTEPSARLSDWWGSLDRAERSGREDMICVVMLELSSPLILDISSDWVKESEVCVAVYFYRAGS
jgi:hypothetical protein